MVGHLLAVKGVLARHNQCDPGARHNQCDPGGSQGGTGSAQSVQSRWQSRGYWLGTISAIQVAVKGILARHNQCDPGGSQGDTGSAQPVRSIQVAVKGILAQHNQRDPGAIHGAGQYVEGTEQLS